MVIQKIRNLIAGKRGQGMTEYIIIVAVIAVAAISVYTLFGKQIRSGVAMLVGQMGGNTATTQTQYESDANDERDKTVNLQNVDNEDF